MTMVEIPLCSPASTPTLNGRNYYKPPDNTRIRLRDFKPERRHIFFALLLAIFLVAIGVCGGLIFVKIFGQAHVEDTAFLNQDVNWQSTCEPRCSGSFEIPPLLLISLDGFRVEYLQRDLTPAISRVLNCGSRGLMFPSFPSKTFPNHLSIVTGLNPESHGIVGSYFLDFNISKDPFTPKTTDSAWFNGNPIWNTALKYGRKSATFFWPGSEVLINGGKPTFSVNYNTSIDFSKRVDQVCLREKKPNNQISIFSCYQSPFQADLFHWGVTFAVVNSMRLVVAQISHGRDVYQLDKKIRWRQLH